MKVTFNTGSSASIEVDGYLYHREQVGQLIEVLDALANQLPLEKEQADTPSPITLREAS